MRIVILIFFLVSFTFAYTQTAIVKRVVDGDTYVLTTGERVRMLGIDAPEMSTYFGNDAKIYLKRLIEGKTIRMESDAMNQDKDRYGRLLRYTYLKNEDINRRMVCDGFAIAYTRFKFSKKTSYLHCQKTATESQLGLWATSGAKDLFNKKKAKKKKRKNQPAITVKEIFSYTIGILSIIFAVALVAQKRRRR